MQGKEAFVFPILAIDPGATCGVCTLREDGTVEAMNWFPHEVMAMVRSDRMDLIGSVVVESIASYGMAVGESVFSACRLIGRIQEAVQLSAKGRFVAALVPRVEVKTHLLGTGRGDDAAVKRRIISIYGGIAAYDGVECKGCENKAVKRRKCVACNQTGYSVQRNFLSALKEHSWQALALALTWRDMPAERRSQFLQAVEQ